MKFVIFWEIFYIVIKLIKLTLDHNVLSAGLKSL